MDKGISHVLSMSILLYGLQRPIFNSQDKEPYSFVGLKAQEKTGLLLMPTAKVTKNVSAAEGGGNVLCSILISIKTKAWLYSFRGVYRYFFLATILFFEKFFLILFPEVYDKRPIPTKLTLHFSQAAFPGGLVLTFPQASSIPQEPISILSLKIIRRTPPIHRWLQPDFTTICSDKPSPPWILRNGKQKSV